MPVRKKDTARALGLLEEYCSKLRKPEEQQLKTAIQRVMVIFKSNLFEALLDIQEFYEVTLLNTKKSCEQKLEEVNHMAHKWEKSVSLPSPELAQSARSPEEAARLTLRAVAAAKKERFRAARKEHLRNQQLRVSFSEPEQEQEQSATGAGVTEEHVHTRTVSCCTNTTTTSSQEETFSNLAKMLETFMQHQMEKEMKQEEETQRQEQRLGTISRQLTQLQLDMEALYLPRDDDPKLMRLEDSDDIEQFLATFERLATVYNWPRRQWAVRLIPLLTGKAQSAFVAMDPAHTQDYDMLKEAVLKQYVVNRESYRQRFRNIEVLPGEPPRELYLRLKDHFCKWVDFPSATKDDIMENMVLEQYLRVLYPEVRVWVKERHPETAAEAAELVDIYIAAQRGSE